MKPVRYVELNGTTHFFYNDDEWNAWKERGEAYGDSGMLLKSRKGNEITYDGYGTIEYPNKNRTQVTIVWNPLFDGEMPDNETIISKQVKNPTRNQSVSIAIIDFSKNTNS